MQGRILLTFVKRWKWGRKCLDAESRPWTPLWLLWTNWRIRTSPGWFIPTTDVTAQGSSRVALQQAHVGQMVLFHRWEVEAWKWGWWPGGWVSGENEACWSALVGTDFSSLALFLFPFSPGFSPGLDRRLAPHHHVCLPSHCGLCCRGTSPASPWSTCLLCPTTSSYSR